MVAKRLQGLPRREVFGFSFPVARGFRSRLLGLSGLDREEAGIGLLIPHCNGVHTFGMRFRLDLVFLGDEGLPLSVRLAVPPRRIAWRRGAVAVLELPSREGERTPLPVLRPPCCPNEKRSPASSSARTTR
jgi:Uncharacterized ACR, COG1430